MARYFFLKLSMLLGGPYIVICDWTIFFGKNPHWAKMTKNLQKWPKNRVFWLFKKTLSLDLSGICVKWKFLWFINTAKTACLGKAWFSSYSQKWLPANEISIFFNRQYFTNTLIPHFDFWHVDRHERKEQRSLRGFVKKFSFGQMSRFMPKNCTDSLKTLDLLEGFFWNLAQ